MSGFGYGPIVLSWAVANASPDTIRAVTAATVVGIGSIGSIARSVASLLRTICPLIGTVSLVSTWTYVQTDASVCRLEHYLSSAQANAPFTEWISYR